MNELATINEIELSHYGTLAHGYRWRDRLGEWHRPEDMATRHVFHTIRMIWNNFMPHYMRFPSARIYDFNPRFYSPEYFRVSLIVLYGELEKRTDVTPAWQRDLDRMRDWLKKYARDGVQRIGEQQKVLK